MQTFLQTHFSCEDSNKRIHLPEWYVSIFDIEVRHAFYTCAMSTATRRFEVHLNCWERRSTLAEPVRLGPRPVDGPRAIFLVPTCPSNFQTSRSLVVFAVQVSKLEGFQHYFTSRRIRCRHSLHPGRSR